MFSQVCIIPSVHMGGMHGKGGAYMAKVDMHGEGGHVW